MDGEYGAAAVSDVIASVGVKFVQDGTCTYAYTVGGSGIYDLSWRRAPVSGASCVNDPAWVGPAVPYGFPDCEYVAKEDVIEVSWLIGGVLFAVWGVKFLRGLFR
ncbi:hypothetical protein PFX98_19800 [Paucibacter sediminis]|uniref:Uncharacterized protein n=1 Tax=Paucibacter sediminis TaxID=3019553 RepID=A0AA95NBQ6_9BURK|nr:hypothetical protein [Paucibacter sp. S2-9]WIT11125.1 hypothetical protein PFX98_19800 [Paucibacter sp. S2-9]